MISCPFCGRSSCGYINESIYCENDLRHFYFECNVCSMQFLIEETMAYNIGALPDHRAKSHLINKYPHVDLPCCEKPTIEDLRGMPLLKHKYHIEVDQYDQEFLQDMAFAFGYKWEMNGQKYLEKKFKYLSIEPETKRMWYNLSDPGANPHMISVGLVDLKGFMQVLNGIEPTEKPSEEEIIVNGWPVQFREDGSVAIHGNLVPYATLFDILETAKERMKDNV